MKPILTLTLLLFGLALSAPGYSVKIKKCQDSDGNWHYGDRATEKCNKSKITELSEKGHKTKVIDAPPTEDELEERARQRAEKLKKQKLDEEQALRDKLLLSTYGHENDILYVRDRKLAQIESSITASNETIANLRKVLERMEKQGEEEKQIKRNMAQIERQEQLIASKRAEQEQIRKQYAGELERYRELQNNAINSAAREKK